MDIELLEAWKLWFDGESLIEYTLLGKSILFWGRVGKVLQFMGAMTIIVEIIGPSRLRVFGKSLRSWIHLTQIRQYLPSIYHWFKHASLVFIYDVTFSLEKRKEFHLEKMKELETEKPRLKLLTLLYVLIIITLPFSVGFLVYFFDIRFEIILIGCATLVFLPFYIFMLTLITLAVAVAIDSFLIKPLAWFLERKSIDTLVKIVALITLIIGFQFDLLAS
jgi:hypothetical protein